MTKSRIAVAFASKPCTKTEQQRSRSVTIPNKVRDCRSATTGMEPMFDSHIILATLCTVSSAVQQVGFLLIISLIFIDSSRSINLLTSFEVVAACAALSVGNSCDWTSSLIRYGSFCTPQGFPARDATGPISVVNPFANLSLFFMMLRVAGRSSNLSEAVRDHRVGLIGEVRLQIAFEYHSP